MFHRKPNEMIGNYFNATYYKFELVAPISQNVIIYVSVAVRNLNIIDVLKNL